MLKGTNIQSGHLLNSFLSTYNKMKGSGTGLSSLQGTAEQTNNMGQRKGSQPPPEVIRENDEESIATDKKDLDELDSDDEELGRNDEEINLETVSVKSSVKSSTSSKQRAILS
jgi:hypothetical protein